MKDLNHYTIKIASDNETQHETANLIEKDPNELMKEGKPITSITFIHERQNELQITAMNYEKHD